MNSRRDFIKQSCTLCLGLMSMGTLVTQLSSCAPMPIFKAEIKEDVIAVPKTSFTDQNKMILIRNSKLEFDILLVRVNENNYNALLMKCTHQDNPLTANKSGLYCSAHGSTFDLEGNVTKEPALTPLKKFKTEVDNSSVLINIKS